MIGFFYLLLLLITASLEIDGSGHATLGPGSEESIPFLFFFMNIRFFNFSEVSFRFLGYRI